MNTDFRFMPEQASSVAGEVDAVYMFLVLVSAVMTVLIAGAIIYFAIKFRRGSKADRSQGKSHFFVMELTWIMVPLVLTMVMFFWGARVHIHQTRPPVGAMEIDCVGRQWMWKFQHPSGAAEINDLHVPLNQPIKVNLISEDVIHSLFVPAFRIKHDVLPGRYTAVWFKPTKIGEYHLFCAEYCGAEHSRMRGRVIVMEPSQYQTWLSGGTGGATSQVAGRQLFEQLRCGTCHQGGGTASRGPPLENLFGSTVRLQGGDTVVADENYLRESILRPAAKVVEGFQPIMPSYEGQIGEEGLLQLIAEIKSRSSPDRNTPPQGSTSPDTRPDMPPDAQGNERTKGAPTP